VFNGRAKYVQLTFGRFVDHRTNFYDRKFKQLKVRQRYPPYDGPVAFPPNLEEMFSLAERLADGLDFVRVDLYNVLGRIVFGEFTCYPDEGLGVFHPPEYDGLFGAQWQLPPRYD